MVTVAITGVGGLIGRRLVAEYDRSDAVEAVIGIDLRAPTGTDSAKLTLRQADICDPGLERLLGDVDVLVHLAFQMDPIHDEERMRAINLDGTRNVLDAAAAAGVGQVVYTSSVAAYGAHPDNEFPLTEDSPLRGNPDLSYADHKRRVEHLLDEWTSEHPEVVVTVLRPSLVAGPGIDNFMSRLLEHPRLLTVKGHHPPLQLAHLDDVVAALVHVTGRPELRGAYNVACEGWLSYDELLAISGKSTIEVGEEVAYSLWDRLWRSGMGLAPAGEVHFLMHPWVMAVDKLIETGWRPKHSNRDALVELLEDHRQWTSLGVVRVPTRRLRAGLATVGGAAGLLGLLGMLRRRRGAPQA